MRPIGGQTKDGRSSTVLRAYVDEAGDRGVSATATDFFVMSQVVVSDTDRPAVQGRLAAIRNHLNARRRVVPPFVYVPGQGDVPNPDPRPKSKMW